MADLEVAEGVSGTWYYHLRKSDQYVALCGAKVMPTKIPLKTWGQVGHLRERYCSKCAEQGGVHEVTGPQEPDDGLGHRGL